VRGQVRSPASLAAAILGSVLAFSLAGCSGAPAATTAPATAAAPATATPDPVVGPTAFPLPSGVAWLEDGKLQPGTYWFDGFDPWLEVTVGEGWEVGHFHRDFFDLFRGGDFPSIGFGRFATVKHRDGTTFPAVDAEAVVEALRSNPDLEVTDVGAASIARLTGSTVDIRAKREQSPLFSTPDGDFKFDPEFISRWHILDVSGGTLQILVAARPGKLDAAIATTQPVLDSLRIVGR
jgi:hypothetical protein